MSHDDYSLGRFPLIFCDAPQFTFAWDPNHCLLYSGQRDGKINQWDIRNGKLLNKFGCQKFEFEDKVYYGHTEIIVDMLIIPKLQYLVTASMDTNVIIWDLTTLKIRRVYKEHTKVIFN